MKNRLLLAVWILCVSACFRCTPSARVTADYDVVPVPSEIVLADSGEFVLGKDTKIVNISGRVSADNVDFLKRYVKEMTGYELEEASAPTENAIVLDNALAGDNPEEYVMTVDKDGIKIDGASDAGVFYGIMTLRKSIPEVGKGDVAFPYGQVMDAPRFPYRGAMFDVCRYFFGVEDVKRFIDILALHNINRFHWHLNDDQGWRIEIKSRPELVAKGSMRTETVIDHNTPEYDGKPHGGFYTQEQAREIVDYAARRHITVVPEIDMPGHMQAALAAYPELGCTGGPYEVWKIFGVSEEVLCAGNDSTYTFLEDVLGEIVEIFPSEIIHIGGDECPKRRWQNCGKCQRKIRELGLRTDAASTAEMKLQTYLTSRMEKYLNGYGRRIMGWDEILEGGLTPGATVMSWRGTEGGLKAAQMGHDVVMAPTDYCYFDYFQSADVESEPDAFGGLVTVEDVYGVEPVPEALAPELGKHIIGAQANLWTTYIPEFDLAEYMLLPRLAAMAEVQWSKPERKDLKEFARRLKRLQNIYDAESYRYAGHLYDIKAAIKPNFDKGIINVALSTIDDSPIRYTLDGSEPTEKSPLYKEPLLVGEKCRLSARVFRPEGRSALFAEEFAMHKGAMKSVELKNAPVGKYRFGGAQTLVDGLTGGPVFQSGRWIGFFGNDMDAVVDLGSEQPVSTVSVNACIAKNDWIFDMRKLSVYVSTDGREFKEVASAEYPKITAASPNGVYPHTLSFEPVSARYVRVLAQSEQRPEGYEVHGMGYLLVDEIVIE